MDYVPALARWLHFMAGVMWIGLLYYFNFVQVAAMKAATADGTQAGIAKHVAPRALLFFRWSAVVTWLAGAALLGNQFGNAFTLSHGMAGIGVGAWLGTIMLFNVWALIWPNQQKILGLKPATDEEKGKARRVAFLASRTNTALSIPLLFFMAGGWSHRAVFGLENLPVAAQNAAAGRPFAPRRARTAAAGGTQPLNRRTASAPARAAPAPRATRSPSAGPEDAESRSAPRSLRSSRRCRRRSSSATSLFS